MVCIALRMLASFWAHAAGAYPFGMPLGTLSGYSLSARERLSETVFSSMSFHDYSSKGHSAARYHSACT